MRRDYSTIGDEWDLIFHAPLIENGNEVINGFTPTIVSGNVVSFGDSRGVFINGRNKSGSYDAIRWDLPDSFINKYADDFTFLGTAELNYSYTNTIPLGGINGWMPNKFLFSTAPSGGWSSLPWNIPYNTQYTVYQQTENNWDTMTNSFTAWNDYNDTTLTAGGSYNSSTATRKFVVVGNSWGNNRCYVGYVRNLKIYRKKL